MDRNKVKIDLAAAADAESSGALAVGHRHSARRPKLASSLKLIRSLVAIFQEAGAETRAVKVGKSSLRLQTKGREQHLIIHS